MNPNKHTPGPWVIGTRKDGSRWFSIGNPETGPHYQADIFCREADARLIAAAPDMLAALKTIGSVLAVRPKTIKDEELWSAFSQIIGAVSKAEPLPLNAEGGDK